MVQKINPHPAPGCNRTPPTMYFQKMQFLGVFRPISSEVLDLCRVLFVFRGVGKNIGKPVDLRGFPVPASLVLPQGSAKEIEIIHRLFLVIAMYCQAS